MSEHYRVEGPAYDYCPTCDKDYGGLMGVCVWPCKPHLLEQIQAVRELHHSSLGLAFVCQGCGQMWPCDTIAALGGDA